MLARLFAKPANVLVLDEPTNDLDIETLELLEELIAQCEGTVLLVTHDRAFLENIVTSTLAFEGGGRVQEYVGGWEDYLRQNPVGARGPALGALGTDAPGARDSGLGASETGAVGARGSGLGAQLGVSGKKKLSYNERRELEQLPARIESLESELATLKTELESPDFYKAGADRIKSVMQRIDELGPELEQVLERWMELEDKT